MEDPPSHKSLRNLFRIYASFFSLIDETQLCFCSPISPWFLSFSNNSFGANCFFRICNYVFIFNEVCISRNFQHSMPSSFGVGVLIVYNVFLSLRWLFRFQNELPLLSSSNKDQSKNPSPTTFAEQRQLQCHPMWIYCCTIIYIHHKVLPLLKRVSQWKEKFIWSTLIDHWCQGVAG